MRFIARVLPFALVFIVMHLLMACRARQETSQTDGFFSQRNKWPTQQISVCWENPTVQNLEERNWVEAAITQQYNDQTAVAFYEWQECGAANIRIYAVDAGPHTKGLGRQIDHVRNGMVLNFDFTTWSRICQTHRESCIKSIAVHEFGHALGFAHEQNRPDRPASCTSEPQGGDGDLAVGRFDMESVMNYCNPVYNNGGRLSATDLRTIELVYGQRMVME